MPHDRPALRPALPASLPGRHHRRGGRVSALALCAAVLMVTLSPAHAQWKWRDASGRVQLSDLPPPASVPDKDIMQRPSAPRRVEVVPLPGTGASASMAAAPASGAGAAAARPKSALDIEVERKRKAEEQEKAAKAKADEERRAAQRADNCQRARSMAATLETGQRIARVNDKGEREFLDDAQRAAEVQRAKSIMSSNCR